MSFSEAVKSCLSQYTTWAGRARRSEFWWFAAFDLLVLFAAVLVDVLLDTRFLGPIAGLALFLPRLAVGVRRLHDTGRSAWWMLIAFVPFVGAIVLLVFYLLDSDPNENRYGPPPKASKATV